MRIREGDTISPKLFTATFEQVYRKLDWEGKGFNMGGEHLNHLIFSDDIAWLVIRKDPQRDIIQQHPAQNKNFLACHQLWSIRMSYNWSFPKPINASSLIHSGCPPAWWTFLLNLNWTSIIAVGGDRPNFLLPEPPKDPPPLLLMIQLVLQPQHLYQALGKAVLDLDTVQDVNPTVEVSSPKDYLMILDHGGVKGVIILPLISY